VRVFKKSNIEFSKDKEVNASGKLLDTLKGYVDNQKFDRDTVVNQLPFFLFLAFLAILYIGNQYHAEKLINEVNQLKKERNEKRAEFISSASDLMKITRQSVVIELLKENNLELKPLTSPPKKIVIKK